MNLNDETLRQEIVRTGGPQTMPKIHEAVAVLAEHFGLTKLQAMEVIRTPTHPRELRDEFAKAAITGVIAEAVCYPEEDMAEMAYKLADAMLKERAK